MPQVAGVPSREFTARDTLLPGSHRASPGVFPSVHGVSGHTETGCIPHHGHGVLGTASALPEWGEKVETSNLELWDDRQFPECPVQLRTPANQVPPGTVWTGEVPQTWLEEPDIPEEERMAAAINHKL